MMSQTRHSAVWCLGRVSEVSLTWPHPQGCAGAVSRWTIEAIAPRTEVCGGGRVVDRPSWAHLGKTWSVTNLSLGSWFPLVLRTSGISFLQQGEKKHCFFFLTHFSEHTYRPLPPKDRSQMLMAGEAKEQGRGLSQEELGRGSRVTLWRMEGPLNHRPKKRARGGLSRTPEL